MFDANKVVGVKWYLAHIKGLTAARNVCGEALYVKKKKNKSGSESVILGFLYNYFYMPN